MTADEARDLFVDAIDGMLDEEQQAQFDALLESDVVLRAEYDELKEVVGAAQSLREDRESLDEIVAFNEDRLPEIDVPIPDLLPGVQRKIRERTRGRYYRDAAPREKAMMPWVPLILVLLTALIVGAAYGAIVLMENEAQESPNRSE